ncbi:MAG: transporter substrate-binding domain-containing protein, partial [Clostridia bacterium]|nr:transporter substrate-binding domain-containing protein [Clostridia bacterium]
MTKFTRLVLASLAIMALLFAAGCGGGTSTPDSSGTPDKKTLLIGSDTAYAPFEWQDTASGKYIGFDMDLMDAIMDELG